MDDFLLRNIGWVVAWLAGVLALTRIYLTRLKKGMKDMEDTRLARKSLPPATWEDIKRLEQTVDRLPEYLDGLPQLNDFSLRPEYWGARLLQLEGYAAQSAAKHLEAIDLFARALARTQNDSQRAALYLLRGNSYYCISNYEAAQADYEDTREMADGISPAEEAAQARAVAVGNLGNIYFQRGEPAKAEAHYDQALSIHRNIGNRLGEAAALGNLGLVYLLRGEFGRAEESHKQALEIAREIGNRLGEAAALGNLGLVYRRRGELDRAKEHFRQAQAIYQQIGARGQGPQTVQRILEEMEQQPHTRGE